MTCTDMVNGDDYMIQVVEYLVSSSKLVMANLDGQDCYGKTALWHACSSSAIHVVKVLLEAGANPMVATRHDYRIEDDQPLPPVLPPPPPPPPLPLPP